MVYASFFLKLGSFLAFGLCAVANREPVVTRSVFFDFSINGENVGRIVFGLFGEVVPKTVENFVHLSRGDRGLTSDGIPLSYEKSQIHRVMTNFWLQGGDFTHGNGQGGQSIFGSEPFEDENFKLKHTGRGVLSMANAGANANSSQFLVSFGKHQFLDNKHVVFGVVRSGWETLDQIERQAGTDNDEPKKKIIIEKCGELLSDGTEVTAKSIKAEQDAAAELRLLEARSTGSEAQKTSEESDTQASKQKESDSLSRELAQLGASKTTYCDVCPEASAVGLRAVTEDGLDNCTNAGTMMQQDGVDCSGPAPQRRLLNENQNMNKTADGSTSLLEGQGAARILGSESMSINDLITTNLSFDALHQHAYSLMALLSLA